jgi:hypothetical protein
VRPACAKARRRLLQHRVAAPLRGGMVAAPCRVMQDYESLELEIVGDDILEIYEVSDDDEIEVIRTIPIDDLELDRVAERDPQAGKAGYAIAWLLGVPLPILLIVYLISRC